MDDYVELITTTPNVPTNYHAFKITVELPLFLSILCISLSSASISNMLLFRTCMYTLHYNETVCDVFLMPERSHDNPQLEATVQKYTTVVSSVKLVVEFVGPAILSLFLGVWSDKYGRKPLLEWPLFGLAIASMMTVVYSMIDSLGPWWYVLTAIPTGLTGSYTILITGAYCYLTDITTVDDRSVRMTILETAVSVGSVIGSLLSSYLLKAIGTVYLLLFVSTLNVIAYCFTTIFVAESLVTSAKGTLLSVIDPSLLRDMIEKCFKVRPNCARAKILLLTLSNSCSVFILYGLATFEYMYTREKLNWSLRQYTMFSASSTTISFIGALFGVAYVQRFLGIEDLHFVLIGFLSACVNYFIQAFATTSWHMYLAITVSLFRDLSAPLIRSFLTKALPVDDIGKIFALMCAIEALCPLISLPSYNTLYVYTLTVFPGSIMILSACLTVCSTLMTRFVIYYHHN